MEVDREHFTLDKLEFFADFFLVPCIIAFLLHYNTASLSLTGSMLILGVFGWTLVEYLMHRFLFHVSRLFMEQHDDHHRAPKALIGNAPWMTFISIVGTWGVLWLLLGVNVACTLTSGLLIGYLMYSVIHVRLHHGDPKKFEGAIARLYQHHIAHHRGGKTNYGVTVDWWDRIFRTKSQRG